MNKVKIITDSACDIDPALLLELGISMVPLTVFFGDESFLDAVEMRGKRFWDMLKTYQGVPRTSQPSVGAFVEVFDRLTADGSPVIAILLSAVLSGTHQSATTAAVSLPDRKITIVNSKTASIGYGLTVLEACDMAEKGMSFEELSTHVQIMVDRTCTVFSVDTLDYLYRNGRIGRALHFWGGVLNFKPILALDREGYVSGVSRVRGSNKVIPAIIDTVGGVVPFGTAVRIGVCHGDDPEAAAELIAQAQSKWLVKRTVETEIGAVIGIHDGPGTLALAVTPVE